MFSAAMVRPIRLESGVMPAQPELRSAMVRAATETCRDRERGPAGSDVVAEHQLLGVGVEIDLVLDVRDRDAGQVVLEERHGHHDQQRLLLRRWRRFTSIKGQSHGAKADCHNPPPGVKPHQEAGGVALRNLLGCTSATRAESPCSMGSPPPHTPADIERVLQTPEDTVRAIQTGG